MDSLRLAVGTFTILPAGMPGHVDRTTARNAMLLAPLIGLLLGAIVALPMWLVHVLAVTAYAELLGATLSIALLAYLTRGLHLDGLADTVDALGSGRRGEEALAIARRGDVGPFGVTAIVVVLALETVALASADGAQRGTLAVIVAVATGRLAATWACVRGIRPARPEGMGALVVGTVPLLAAAAWTLLLVALALGLAWCSSGGPRTLIVVTTAVVSGLLASGLLVRRASRRLVGVTGDVLGAAIECATATTLVIIAFA